MFKNDKHKSCNINLAKIYFQKYQTSVGISPQNLLNFSFNTFATLLSNFEAIPSTISTLLHLKHDHPSKK